MELGNSFIFLTSSNPDRAKNFYRDVLGFNLVREEAQALTFDTGGLKLRISIAGEEIQGSNIPFGLEVYDIDQAIKNLKDRGAQISVNEQGEEWIIWEGYKFAYFSDFDGNVLLLLENRGYY